MKLLSNISVTLLALLVFAVPTMACLTPDAQLTDEEKTCCREMANQCGDTEMSSDHSCCQKLIIQHHDLAVVKEISRFVVAQVSLHAATVEASFHLHASMPLAFLLDRLRHPPPEPVTPSIEILRI